MTAWKRSRTAKLHVHTHTHTSTEQHFVAKCSSFSVNCSESVHIKRVYRCVFIYLCMTVLNCIPSNMHKHSFVRCERFLIKVCSTVSKPFLCLCQLNALQSTTLGEEGGRIPTHSMRNGFGYQRICASHHWLLLLFSLCCFGCMENTSKALKLILPLSYGGMLWNNSILKQQSNVYGIAIKHGATSLFGLTLLAKDTSTHFKPD